MITGRPLAPLLLAALALVGCGAIGDLQPPTLDIPRPVSDLRVVQRGDKVVIDFTIPELTTEGLALRLAKVELRAGEESLDTAGMNPGPAHLELDASRWEGQEVSFRVRLFSPKGRDSGWSDPVALRVIPSLAPPAGLKAETVVTGVRLSWEAAADAGFRVRRDGEVVATATGREWLDTSAQYGKKYEYSLQAVIVDGSIHAESAVSPPVQITPTDRFPPSVPKDLAAIAGSSSVELAWDPGPDADLRGYSVYRSSGDQQWQRVAEAVPAPSYSDRDVKLGITYRYAVSSVDRSGNESERSAAVDVTLP